MIKTPRDGLPWFSARRARRGDARHRKAGATTSASLIAGESHGKPPFGSRPLIAGGRQAALTMRCIARGSLAYPAKSGREL